MSAMKISEMKAADLNTVKFNPLVTTSPHLHTRDTVQSIMLWVCIALLPAAIWGIYSFGIRALLVLLVSTAAAVLTEYVLSEYVFKKKTIQDLSAVVTGLLVGMNMPPRVPLFVPVIASIFAIAVAKMTFGGLGQNFANPAIAGRIFVFFSFTSLMSSFVQPQQLLGNAQVVTAAPPLAVDAFTSATPLSFFKSHLNHAMPCLSLLASSGYGVTPFAANLSGSTGINPYIVDAFFGNVSGCIGETSALLILVGGVILLAKKIISWHIPVSYLVSYAIFEWVFGGMVYGAGLFQSFSGVVYSLLTGGIFLCAFFMATDMVTSPITKKGQLVFGLGLGLFTFLFRRFSSLPEGVSVALLLMNVITPTINKYMRNRVMGVRKNG